MHAATRICTLLAAIAAAALLALAGGVARAATPAFPDLVTYVGAAGSSATVSWNVDPLTTTCSPGPGAAFPLGISFVQCSAQSACAAADPACVAPPVDVFAVRVVADTTAPSMIVHDQVARVAPGEHAAVVTYPAPRVLDGQSGVANAACVPASGASFPIGTTTVTCHALDKVGNAGTATFQVAVLGLDTPAAGLSFDRLVAGQSVPGQLRRAAVLKGVAYTVSCSEACAIGGRLAAGAKLLGTATASLRGAGTATVSLRVSRAGRRLLLGHRHPLELQVVTDAADVAGNARVLTSAIALL